MIVVLSFTDVLCSGMFKLCNSVEFLRNLFLLSLPLLNGRLEQHSVVTFLFCWVLFFDLWHQPPKMLAFKTLSSSCISLLSWEFVRSLNSWRRIQLGSSSPHLHKLLDLWWPAGSFLLRKHSLYFFIFLNVLNDLAWNFSLLIWLKVSECKRVSTRKIIQVLRHLWVPCNTLLELSGVVASCMHPLLSK